MQDLTLMRLEQGSNIQLIRCPDRIVVRFTASVRCLIAKTFRIAIYDSLIYD